VGGSGDSIGICDCFIGAERKYVLRDDESKKWRNRK
jgi:hypothetical protein